MLSLGANNLNLVAVKQLGDERHWAAVYLAANAGVADVGMHRIGKVDRVGATRKRDQASVGGEAEHLILEQLELGVLEEFFRIVTLKQNAHEVAQPSIGVAVLTRRHVVACARAVVGVLIKRMSCDAVLGHRVHPLGANLQLHALMARSDDGGVDRLIIVRLGIGDVVLEASWNRVPGGVHDGKRPVAVGCVVPNDDAEAVDVRELLKRNLLALHLAPDGVRLLLAVNHGGGELCLFELGGERGLNLAD